MPYGTYDSTKPVNTDLGTAVLAEILQNTEALRDGVLMGQMQGFAYAVSGGTAEEPSVMTWTKSADILRATLTWTSGNITGIHWERSYNTGGAWVTIGTDPVLTYSSGNLTSVTNTSGMLSFLFYLLAKVKSMLTTVTAHVGSAVGSAHSGVGTIAAQAASSVAITGGAIDGTAIGGTTPAAITAQTYKGKGVSLGATITGSTAVDWSAGDYFYCTFTGSGAAFTWSNLPAADRAQGITIEIVYPSLATSPWPAGVKWPSGTAPTRSGSGKTDIYEFVCRDGSTVRGSQAVKDSA